jgi:hypothetical protein
MVDAVSTMKELYDSISDELVSAFESMNEEMDKSIARIEHMTSVADTFYNIIDLAGKESLGINKSLLNDIRSTQLTTNQNQLIAQKAKLE